jgi:hypothetical protein
MKHEIIRNEESSYVVRAPMEGDVELTVTAKEEQLSCSCNLSKLAGLPCSHEIFVCRLQNLDYSSWLLFKPRWFKKFESKVLEKLY